MKDNQGKTVDEGNRRARHEGRSSIGRRITSPFGGDSFTHPAGAPFRSRARRNQWSHSGRGWSPMISEEILST